MMCNVLFKNLCKFCGIWIWNNILNFNLCFFVRDYMLKNSIYIIICKKKFIIGKNIVIILYR